MPVGITRTFSCPGALSLALSGLSSFTWDCRCGLCVCVCVCVCVRMRVCVWVWMSLLTLLLATPPSSAPLSTPCTPCRRPAADTPAVTGFAKLNLLNISDNELSRWADVAKFGVLPRVQSLFMSNNRVTTLNPGDESASAGAGAASAGAGSSAAPSLFPVLETLSMSDNAVSEWAALDYLRLYPSVSSFRFQNNPLVSGMGPGQSRQVCSRERRCLSWSRRWSWLA